MEKDNGNNAGPSRDTESLGRLLVRLTIPALIIMMTWVFTELLELNDEIHELDKRLAVLENRMDQSELNQVKNEVYQPRDFDIKDQFSNTP